MNYKRKSKSIYSFKVKGFMLMLSLIISSFTYAAIAQQRSVQGQVMDENGEPLVGATVAVKGTTTGTITDLDGNFTISAANGDVLSVQYVGYRETVVTVGNQSQYRITLQEDSQLIDEVVVVGYGTQKKSDVTGAMVSVGAEELKSRPTTNVFEAMQGRAAGVDIRTSDRPGEMGDVFIRGIRSLTASSSPLYVVDGVPLNSTVGKTPEETLDDISPRGGALESLNPSDIESVEVLKDASATAIYGSRGANGVVLITTKRGKEGRFTVNYSGSVSTDKIKDRTTWMTAGEYLEWRRWAYYYRDPNAYPRGDQPTQENDKAIFNGNNDTYAWANIMKGWAGGTWDGSKVTTTDWTDYVTQTGITTEHTISGSGGNEKSQSYLSFGWLSNEGTIKGQDYNRYTAKVSNDLKLTQWLSLGATINATYSTQNYGMSNDGGTTSGPRSAYAAATRNLPYAVPYDDNGNRIDYPGADTKIKTVVDEWQYSTDERKVFRALGSFYGQLNLGKIWEPLEGLSYKINFGPDFRYYRRGMFNDEASVNREGTNYASLTKSTDFSWTLDNLVYYNRSVGKHDFGLTLLQTATKYEYESNYMAAQKIPLSSSLWNALSTTNVSSLDSWNSSLTEKQLLSYMARVNYTYNSRYMLTASVRRDGASQLAEGHKWATFPSVALGWRIEQEDFMKDMNWINQLKLRLGYGVTGNSAIDPYQTKGSVVSLFYPFGSSSTAGYVGSESLIKDGVVAMANQNLGWEKTKQWNVGIDFGFLNGRVSGIFDIYTSRTDDLLMEQSIPSLTGYMNTYNNIGETKNFGYDLTLNLVPVRTRDFEWSIGLNAAYTKNEIVSLANGKEDDITNGWFIGESTYVIYSYESAGVWKEEDAAEMAKFNANGHSFEVGMARPVDQNGDYKIDANDDRVVIGHRDPRWTLGLNTNLNYKGWDLGIQLYGRMDYTYDTGGIWVGGRYNVRKYDYYNENNKNASYQKPIFDEGGKDAYYYVLGYKSGSYLKIRNISLGYTFPNKLIKSTGLSNLKLYAQCKNPGMIFSKIDHLDMDTYSNTYNTGFTFGLNVSF
ncbi:MAG: TonB-dependent receptor [Tannerella sp.]|jgi:TonB-linked SusC/RagA family outer membrane protein|nr:TonB-dependent receptor [Tannerella sp.]